MSLLVGYNEETLLVITATDHHRCLHYPTHSLNNKHIIAWTTSFFLLLVSITQLFLPPHNKLNKNLYLLSIPPSTEALRHSGFERRLRTSSKETRYFCVALNKERRPGTRQNSSSSVEVLWKLVDFWSGASFSSGSGVEPGERGREKEFRQKWLELSLNWLWLHQCLLIKNPYVITQ